MYNIVYGVANGLPFLLALRNQWTLGAGLMNPYLALGDTVPFSPHSSRYGRDYDSVNEASEVQRD